MAPIISKSTNKKCLQIESFQRLTSFINLFIFSFFFLFPGASHSQTYKNPINLEMRNPEIRNSEMRKAMEQSKTLTLKKTSGKTNPSGSITIHYHRNEGDYNNWQLWIWGLDSSNGLAVTPVSKNNFGLLFKIDTKNFRPDEKIGILPRMGDWLKKDGPERILDIAVINNSKNREIFLVQNFKNIFYSRPDTSPKLVKAFLDSESQIRAVFSKTIDISTLTSKDFSLEFLNIAPNDTCPKLNIMPFNGVGKIKKCKVLDLTIKIGWPLKNKIQKNKLITFIMKKNSLLILKTKKFGNQQIMPGNILDTLKPETNSMLGMVLEHEKLMFRVFSPLSEKLCLNILKDSKKQIIPLEKRSDGTWEKQINTELMPFYYNLLVTFSNYDCKNNRPVKTTIECMDPYVLCTAFHTKNNRGTMGLVHKKILNYKNPGSSNLKSSETDKSLKLGHPKKINLTNKLNSNLTNKLNRGNIIYEMHVRDFIIQDKKGGTYSALASSSRLEHIKALGITHIQLMPLQDFDHNFRSNEYNWGYMPVFFNSPEEWYADTKTSEYLNSPGRIFELKSMIKKIHSLGLKAVLDVVYNHTAESPVNAYSFEALAPGYYYRQNRDGSFSNGSGCGNEFASEKPFAGKFIIDSLKYWVEAYDFDGYRFDLMGLIDVDTLKKCVTALKKIKPEILVYGEPWAAGPTPIKPTEKGAQRGLGFSVFNDIFRDSIRGSVWDRSTGYVSSKGATPPRVIDNLKKTMKGSLALFADSPNESINYVACHDNRTLYDRLIWTLDKKDHKHILNMIKMSNMILFLSQGIPFIHSGQEMLRTKDLEHNSYNLSDKINMIDWNPDKNKMEILDFTKYLIKIRKEHPCFRLKNAEMVKKRISFLEPEKTRLKQVDLNQKIQPGITKNKNSCIVCLIDCRKKKNLPQIDGESFKQALIIFNPYEEVIEISIPSGEWRSKIENSNIPKSENRIITIDKFMAEPFSGTLLFQ